MSRHSRAVASLRKVVADASQQAADEARRAERQTRAPVPYSLTARAEAALGTRPSPNRRKGSRP